MALLISAVVPKSELRAAGSARTASLRWRLRQTRLGLARSAPQCRQNTRTSRASAESVSALERRKMPDAVPPQPVVS